MNFIKKVADKNFDESVHSQFVKFSRGEFRNRAVIKAKLSKGKRQAWDPPAKPWWENRQGRSTPKRTWSGNEGDKTQKIKRNLPEERDKKVV